MRYINRV